jgi:hypothetical protein
MAEAIAGLQSIRAIMPIYAGKIYLENDCSSLITELKGAGSSKLTISSTVEDITNLLETMPDYRVAARRSR